MPLPTVYNVGTVASSTTTAVAPGIPATTVQDDILILLVESQNEPINATTGFTNVGVGTVPQASGLVTSLTVRWKRAINGEAAPSVSASPQNHIIARIIGVRGCVTAGSPINGTPATLSDNGTTTAFSIPGGTTTAIDCLVIAALATGTDIATAQLSGSFSNASLGSVTTQVNNWTASGTGGGFAGCSGTLAAQGAYSATTGTLVTGNTKASMSFALQGATVVAVPPRAPVVSAIPAYRERQGFRQWPM